MCVIRWLQCSVLRAVMKLYSRGSGGTGQSHLFLGDSGGFKEKKHLSQCCRKKSVREGIPGRELLIAVSKCLVKNRRSLNFIFILSLAPV